MCGAGAGAIAYICAHADTAPRMLTRRDFVAAALAAPALSAGAQTAGFPLGVAAGDPRPDGFVIWTRLARDVLHPDGAGGLPAAPIPTGWQVAEDEGFTRIAVHGEALARPEDAHTLHVAISGLRPGRPYWYRFAAAGAHSDVGRARTAPAPDTLPDALSWAVAGCQRYDHGLYAIWRDIARQELDFVFHYGDYIYEYALTPGGGREMPQAPLFLPLPTASPAEMLAAYRNRHALTRLDPDLRAAHAAHAFVVSFDDHEVQNNWSADTRWMGSVERRTAALKAWWEHMPLPEAMRPEPDGAVTAHRRLRFGALADLLVLDTRQHRARQACAVSWSGEPPCEEMLHDAAHPRALLGGAQEAWLAHALAAPTGRWSVLAEQVLMMPWRMPGGGVDTDKWDGYPTQRGRVLDMLAARPERARNALVLSGDIHSAYAGEIWRDAAGPGAGRLAVEFTGTSVTSGRNGHAGPAARKAQPGGDLNPHIAFSDNRRGWLRMELHHDRAEAHFRAAPRVDVPDIRLTEIARFAVEAGRMALVSG